MDPTRRLIIQYPSEQQIVRINQIQIKLKGGLPFVPPFNYRDGGPPLSLILDTISEPLYGVEPYLGICNKAAALAWKIIEGHVFNDANKRTGMHAGIVLTKINHKPISTTSADVVDIALKVANGRCTVEELGIWFFRRAK